MTTARHAADDLERLASRLDNETDRVLSIAAERIVDQLNGPWPVDTGESLRGFEAVGSAVINDVPYTEFVHDGLVHELIPNLARQQAEKIEADIDVYVQGVI